MKYLPVILIWACVSATAMLLNPCDAAAQENIPKTVIVDGSSTVFPVTNAVASYYMKMYKKSGIVVGESGTGGGFELFIKGETDINNSSRRPNPDELAEMEANNISFLELKIATDGIAVVTNPENSFVTDLTIAELALLWKNGSEVQYWSDLRPGWPQKQINLYGPGLNSGTRDYFESQVFENGETMRKDYIMSEHDNELVNAVKKDANGMAFFGLSYYHKNKNSLKSIAINSGHGPVDPTYANVKSGSYQPFSRSLYLHVNKRSLHRPEVTQLLSFYMRMAQSMAQAAGYVPFQDSFYKHQNDMILEQADQVVSR